MPPRDHGTAASQRDSPGPSYQPGEPLSAFQFAVDRAPGSGKEDKFEIVSSVYRLKQSKCFLESQGQLSCTTCHKPHDIQRGQAGLQGYNQSGMRCHEPAKIAATAHAANLVEEIPDRHGPEWEYRGEVVPYGDQDELDTAVAQVTHQRSLEWGIPRLQAEIARKKPERPEFYMELGNALQHGRRPEESAAAYRLALQKRPGSALLWACLAMPLRASGKTRAPREAMLKSAQADPGQPQNWRNLGLLPSSLGDKRAAVASFRKAIAFDPESADFHNSLGAVLTEIGQPQEAESKFRAALRLRPVFASTHAHLAYMMANRREFEQAVWHYERAGEGAVNQFSYGITLARMNRLPEARVHLQKSLDADPNQPLAHEVLGRLLEAAGEVPSAVAHYREAIRQRPGFGQAHLNLGALLARQGNRTKAALGIRP